MALGGASREFMLRIVADVSDATRGMKQVEASSDTMKSRVAGVGKAVVGALATTAVLQFGKDSVQAAAEAEMAMQGVKQVFGDSASEIEAFSDKAITSMGISDDAFQGFATTTGGLLRDMGVPMDATIAMTEQLADRGADLATVYGVDTESAFTAMQKAMGGSYKGLRQLGIQLDKNEVEARAMSEGWVDAEGNVTDAGRAMATQALIMEKTADKAGAYEESSGNVAQQQKELALQFEETKEQVGKALLPVLSKLMNIMQPLLAIFTKYANILVPIAGIIAGIVLATKAYQMAETAVTAVKGAATAAQWALNASLLASPITWIVIAIAALIAAFVLLYMKVDWFRKGVDAAIDGIVAAFQWLWDMVMKVFNWIKDNWPLLLAIITGPFGMAVYIIAKNWDTIVEKVKWVIRAIRNVLSDVWNIISWPFKKAAQIISSVIQNIRDWFWRLPGQIRGFLSGLFDILFRPFRDAKDNIVNVLTSIKDWFWRLPGEIRNFLGPLENIIKAPFQAAFNAVKWLWNSTIGGFGFTVPSWVPVVGGRGFRIPEMAAGGIVTAPTVALIGEAGPEAVIPLGRSGKGGGFGNTTIINVYALTANAEVGRKVYEALREYERTSGKAIA